MNSVPIPEATGSASLALHRLFFETCLDLLPLVPQALFAVTEMVPPLKLDAKFTVMLLLPCPDARVEVAGTVQLKVTPLTAATEYTSPLVPGHTLLLPEIAEGVEGGDEEETEIELESVLPQLLETVQE